MRPRRSRTRGRGRAVQIDPRTLVRVGLFARLGLLGVVSLAIQPPTGVVLILVAGGRMAFTLLPWESWLPVGSSPPVPQPAAATLETRAGPPERN